MNKQIKFRFNISALDVVLFAISVVAVIVGIFGKVHF